MCRATCCCSLAGCPGHDTLPLCVYRVPRLGAEAAGFDALEVRIQMRGAGMRGKVAHFPQRPVPFAVSPEDAFLSQLVLRKKEESQEALDGGERTTSTVCLLGSGRSGKCRVERGAVLHTSTKYLPIYLPTYSLPLHQFNCLSSDGSEPVCKRRSRLEGEVISTTRWGVACKPRACRASNPCQPYR